MKRLELLVFVVMVVSQIVIPIVQLSKPRPAHFGWQMYSGVGRLPRYWIVAADGSTKEVDLRTFIFPKRAEADYHDVLREHLRRLNPDASALRWQFPESKTTEEYRWAH